MKPWLMVGDPHVTVDELADCEALEDFNFKIGQEQDCQGVIYLGDLHNNHALINAHVMAFWRKVFARWVAAGKRVIALVGNHDRPGDGSKEVHALLAYPEIEVVDETTIIDGVLYLPYLADPAEFCRYANFATNCKTIICHQDFDGAQYENGFYSPNGVDPKQISQQVISGHIHSPQRFGNVWYPGAPRWRTLSDANINRAVWTVDIEDGVVTPLKGWNTGDVCKRIMSRTVTPEYPFDAEAFLYHKDELRLHIEGPQQFIADTLVSVGDLYPTMLQNGGIRISTLVTDDKAIRVKESEGIGVAFHKYVDAFEPPQKTDKSLLEKLANERIHL